jgi:uncharacterized membrane protein
MALVVFNCYLFLGLWCLMPLSTIQIQIFYLLITVPIAEQNNQTMNKHYDWLQIQMYKYNIKKQQKTQLHQFKYS